MKTYTTFLLLVFQMMSLATWGQEEVRVDLSLVEGIDITPDNIFNYQIHSSYSQPQQVTVKGEIRYRQSGMFVRYEFAYLVRPGVNWIRPGMFSPRFQYSSTALRELFQDYKRLPEGIYEYCVSVVLDQHTSETQRATVNQCTYQKATNVFLINLVDPQDDARLYTFYPSLNWTVNFPFFSALTYTIKVAEIRDGQQAASAVARNNPLFKKAQLRGLSLTYPAYAAVLEVDQPYAWQVSAYYKGLLLGSSEVWKFTIVEDSLITGIAKDPSYVDISRETGKYQLYAPGILKIKYELKELRTDSLRLTLLDQKQRPVKFKDTLLVARNGDNRFVIDFQDQRPLKHLKPYILLITSQTGAVYRVLFKYVDPLYIR